MIGGHLPPVNSLNCLFVLHIGIKHRAVKERGYSFLHTHGFKQYGVPYRIVTRWVSMHIIQNNLFKKSGFSAVLSMCSHRPHTNLGRSVSAEYRSVMNNNNASAVSCRRYCGAHTRKAAAYNAYVGIIFIYFLFRSHIRHLSSLLRALP